MHCYDVSPPKWMEIRPNHWVLANDEEFERYKEALA